MDRAPWKTKSEETTQDIEFEFWTPGTNTFGNLVWGNSTDNLARCVLS